MESRFYTIRLILLSTGRSNGYGNNNRSNPIHSLWPHREILQSCGRSEISSSLQVNESSCHSFMDAGKICETLQSETKDSYSDNISQSFIIVSSSHKVT